MSNVGPYIGLTNSFVFTSNDLWALGCTLYQMLSGSAPFKDAIEWLIYQRIVARDLRFPDHISDEARDLIDKLLVFVDSYKTFMLYFEASLVVQIYAKLFFLRHFVLILDLSDYEFL